jgi:hypothetical protein
MGISLQSIPHQQVDYFIGKVLVLALSPADCQAVPAWKTGETTLDPIRWPVSTDT